MLSAGKVGEEPVITRERARQAYDFPIAMLEQADRLAAAEQIGCTLRIIEHLHELRGGGIRRVGKYVDHDVLDARGHTIRLRRPQPLTDEVVRAADVVVTMGCGDACPIYPGNRYLDWDLEDPAGKPLEEVRPIRDEIDRGVRTLLDELVSDAKG